HAEALAAHEAQRQALVVVLLRHDAVEARLDEEFGPALERTAVDHLGVLGVEVLDLFAQVLHRSMIAFEVVAPAQASSLPLINWVPAFTGMTILPLTNP